LRDSSPHAVCCPNRMVSVFDKLGDKDDKFE